MKTTKTPKPRRLYRTRYRPPLYLFGMAEAWTYESDEAFKIVRDKCGRRWEFERYENPLSGKEGLQLRDTLCRVICNYHNSTKRLWRMWVYGGRARYITPQTPQDLYP